MNDPLERLGPLPESRSGFRDIADRLDECERWDVPISLAALGDLAPPEHLSACAACREIYDGRRKAILWLDFLPESRALMPVRRASWIRSAVAAVALVLALSIFAVRPTTTPERARPIAQSVRFVEALTSPDEGPIVQAARRLGEGRLVEIRALGDYLRSQSASDRRYLAVRLLVHIGGPAAEEELLKTLPDAAVAAGLGDLKSRRAVPRLMDWLSRPDLRSAAARALGEIGDERAIPALLREGRLHAGILKFFGKAVLRYAIAHPEPALAALRDPLIDQVLLDHAGEQPDFREALLDVADEDLMIQALLRTELLEAALRRPVERLVPRLAARLPHPSAIRALARIGSEAAWSAILSRGCFSEALPDADALRLAQVVSRWAKDRDRAPLLARLVPVRPEYKDFFREALEVPAARGAACVAIGHLKDRSAIPKLIPLLKEDPEVSLTLRTVTGERFGLDRQAWWHWWHQVSRKL
jgi:hypothetical protein